jgi:hypothetical protein
MAVMISFVLNHSWWWWGTIKWPPFCRQGIWRGFSHWSENTLPAWSRTILYPNVESAITTCYCFVFCCPCSWQLCGLKIVCLPHVCTFALLVLYVYHDTLVFSHVKFECWTVLVLLAMHSMYGHSSIQIVVHNDWTWFDSSHQDWWC